VSAKERRSHIPKVERSSRSPPTSHSRCMHQKKRIPIATGFPFSSLKKFSIIKETGSRHQTSVRDKSSTAHFWCKCRKIETFKGLKYRDFPENCPSCPLFDYGALRPITAHLRVNMAQTWHKFFSGFFRKIWFFEKILLMNSDKYSVYLDSKIFVINLLYLHRSY